MKNDMTHVCGMLAQFLESGEPLTRHEAAAFLGLQLKNVTKPKVPPSTSRVTCHARMPELSMRDWQTCRQQHIRSFWHQSLCINFNFRSRNDTCTWASRFIPTRPIGTNKELTPEDSSSWAGRRVYLSIGECGKRFVIYSLVFIVFLVSLWEDKIMRKLMSRFLYESQQQGVGRHYDMCRWHSWF